MNLPLISQKIFFKFVGNLRKLMFNNNEFSEYSDDSEYSDNPCGVYEKGIRFFLFYGVTIKLCEECR